LIEAALRRAVLMKRKKTKNVRKDKRIVCGTPNNLQDAYREVDPDMKVVWTQAGFWALPLK
jgi:hypothetical protein